MEPPTEDLGFGVGVRLELVDEILAPGGGFDFHEVVTEDFLAADPPRRRILHALAARGPIVLHGLSLSIAGSDPLDLGYLARLRDLADEVGARWVSDHLCWTGIDGVHTHELLPVPLTEAALAHVTARVHAAQELLGRSLVLENPSSYLAFDESTMPEPEFLGRLVAATGCRLLLDVNNVYVSASNLGFDAAGYLEALPAEAVAQIHLGGSRDMGAFLLDSHDEPVRGEVWELYRHACRRVGAVSTSLEWDTGLPENAVLRKELATAARIRAEAASGPAAPWRGGTHAPAPGAAGDPALAADQRALQAAILDGVAQKATPAGDGPRPLSRAEGVAVLGGAYRARHLDRLRAAFPVLGELLGAELDGPALDHIAEHPARAADEPWSEGLGDRVVAAWRDDPRSALVRDAVALDTAAGALRRPGAAKRRLRLEAPGFTRALAARAGAVLDWAGDPGPEAVLVRDEDGIRAAFPAPVPAAPTGLGATPGA